VTVDRFLALAPLIPGVGVAGKRPPSRYIVA
jgi:hypothetical protein